MAMVEAVPDRWLPRGGVVCESEDHKPLVVWGGIPGEPAMIRIVHRGQHQVQGEWTSSAVPSPHRVQPPCDKYSRCGGCPWMHVDAEGQLDGRRERVRWALANEDITDVSLGPVKACPDGLSGYRHVIKVGFGRSDIGRVRMGAWSRGSRDITPVPDCVAAAPILRATMKSLAHHVIDLGIDPFDENTGRGVLRSAVLRASRTTGEVLVTLVAARRDRRIAELAENFAQGSNEVVGVWLHLNGGPGNAIFQRDGDGVVGASPLGGKGWIEERLNDIAYRIGPADFFQTNPSVAELLYRRTASRLELEEGDAVVDLYCGVGGMALLAARTTGFAVGIEEIDGAVHRAREAARINRVPAEFISDNVVHALPDLEPRLAQSGAKVIVDPARRGLEDGVLDKILALNPSRIAYISCNARTLARDLKRFRNIGWRVDAELELFDMFPNTAHVEILAILLPPEGAEPPTRRAPKRRLAR